MDHLQLPIDTKDALPRESKVLSCCCRVRPSDRRKLIDTGTLSKYIRQTKSMGRADQRRQRNPHTLALECQCFVMDSSKAIGRTAVCRW